MTHSFTTRRSSRLTGKWPFGERAHGTPGLEEAYADALGIPNRRRSLLYHLRLLSQDWPKGHWSCPCGSGKRLRHCHRDEAMAIHQRVPPHVRSEEHTSELQSLMCISYAIFC